MRDNYFASALSKIAWDKTFEADGEHYFAKGNMIFTTPSIDPFQCDWAPSMITSDGSYMTF